MNQVTQPTFASFYDFYDAPKHRQDQLAMYRSLAMRAGKAILELACGTGIIAIDLARAGFHVTGLDISPEMLAVAREKLVREDPAVRPRLHLVEGDMKDFHLDQVFDAIFLTCNSFGHLTTTADQKSCLRAIGAHLRPSGMLVIEERHYPPPMLMDMWQMRLAFKTQTAEINPATGRHTSFHRATAHIDFVSQTIHSRSFIDEVQEDGSVRRYFRGDGRASNHYFSPTELQLLIEQGGFVITDSWGSPVGDPIGPRSYNMIFVAQQRSGETYE